MELIFDVLLSGDKGKGVLSWRQLFLRLIQVQNCMPQGFRAYLNEFRRRDKSNTSVDESIRAALMFLRTWAEFQLPRSILAIDRIQKNVFPRYKMPVGDYAEYADMVKHWFRPPAETILEEYGLPMPMTAKIDSINKLPDSVDDVLDFVSKIDTRRYGWTEVEQSIYEHAFPHLKDDGGLIFERESYS